VGEGTVRVMFFGGQEKCARDLNATFIHTLRWFSRFAGANYLSGRSLKTRAQEQRHSSRPHPTGTLIQEEAYVRDDEDSWPVGGEFDFGMEEAYFGSEFTHPSGPFAHQTSARIRWALEEFEG